MIQTSQLLNEEIGFDSEDDGYSQFNLPFLDHVLMFRKINLSLCNSFLAYIFYKLFDHCIKLGDAIQATLIWYYVPIYASGIYSFTLQKMYIDRKEKYEYP